MSAATVTPYISGWNIFCPGATFIPKFETGQSNKKFLIFIEGM